MPRVARAALRRICLSVLLRFAFGVAPIRRIPVIATMRLDLMRNGIMRRPASRHINIQAYRHLLTYGDMRSDTLRYAERPARVCGRTFRYLPHRMDRRPQRGNGMISVRVF